jgi:hypothetical protein
LFFLKNSRTKIVKPLLILSLAFLGISIIEIPYRIIHFELTLFTLPNYIFHVFGLLMGYWFYKVPRTGKILVMLLSLCACIFICVFYKWM